MSNHELPVCDLLTADETDMIHLDYRNHFKEDRLSDEVLVLLFFA